VIRSISARDSWLASTWTPPMAPPKGTSIRAHWKVTSAAKALTSATVTDGANRMPPAVGVLCWLCWARHPCMTSMSPESRMTGKLRWITLFGCLICSRRPEA
jgi:hypothetical protein